MSDPILFAMAIDGDGGGASLQGEAISRRLRDDALGWVHLDANNEATRGWLKRELSYLDDLILDALLAEETRPRMVEYPGGVLLILRGVNLNEGADPEDMVSIRLWVDPHRIISLRKRRILAVKDMRERLERGTGPRDAGDFIAQLTARLLDRMEPVLGELDERMDGLEERVIETVDTASRQPITELRKEAILFRRHIAPQRDAVAQLRASDAAFLTVQHRRQLQESQDRLTRHVEGLDAIRERAQIVKDELVNALSDRLNRNLYILATVSAVFLPLTFVTGLLGINVGGIPGAEDPRAFWMVAGGMATLMLVLLGLLRLRRWL